MKKTVSNKGKNSKKTVNGKKPKGKGSPKKPEAKAENSTVQQETPPEVKGGLPATIPEPVGRPSSYRPEFTGQVYKLALLGLIDTEMAEYFEVCEATFNNWKRDYPEFLESMRAGKTHADANVAEKLYQRTQGCMIERDVPTKIKRVEYDPDTGKKTAEYEDVVVTKVFEQVMPDVTAQGIWLHNRDSKRWKSKQTLEHTGKDGKELPAAVTMVNLNDKQAVSDAVREALNEY